MNNAMVPVVGIWYHDRELNTLFEVIAVDESDRTIEIQDFDGSVDEIDMDTWTSLYLEVTPAPEDYSGALDIGEIDDFGTEITDTSPEDWILGPVFSESHEANGYDEEQQLTDWVESST
ncbi:MAG: hypothetical protein HUJ29_06545 [Gammaproteobacteria bacterium]|nr:hypothetical protein [Gammaproteobacteria bacterium]